MARKVHQLKHEEEPYQLLAVACHEPDYRVSWILNQAFSLNLARTTNLQVTDARSGDRMEFSRFTFEDENRMISWFLLSNHTENAFFAPELKNIDFFLRLSGEINPGTLKEILDTLKKTPGILTAFVTDKKTIRNHPWLQF